MIANRINYQWISTSRLTTDKPQSEEQHFEQSNYCRDNVTNYTRKIEVSIEYFIKKQILEEKKWISFEYLFCYVPVECVPFCANNRI